MARAFRCGFTYSTKFAITRPKDSKINDIKDYDLYLACTGGGHMEYSAVRLVNNPVSWGISTGVKTGTGSVIYWALVHKSSPETGKPIDKMGSGSLSKNQLCVKNKCISQCRLLAKSTGFLYAQSSGSTTRGFCVYGSPEKDDDSKGVDWIIMDQKLFGRTVMKPFGITLL